MPRGGGPTFTYSLPAIYLAIPGTLITAAQHNTPLEDIASTFNTAWPVNLGGTGGTSAAAILSGDNTFTGSNAFNGAFALYGTQPETLAAQADNLSLDATTNDLTIDLTGDQSLTGITGGSNGRIVTLRNIDASENLTLVNDATSTASNRFLLPGAQDFIVLPGQSVTLKYSASRWQLIAQTYSTGTDAGDLVQVGADGNLPAQFRSASIVGASKNLSGQYLTASTASYAADELIMKDSSGNAHLSETVSFTVDITASGVNGLDTGSEASDTWYYVYAIYNGTDTNGLISASATAPTLPSGYTYSALIGSIRNDTSSDFVSFLQNGRKHSTIPLSVFVGASGISALTSVSISSQVPPIAKLCDGWLGNASTSVTAGVRVASTSTGIGSQGLNAQSSGIVYDGYAIRMTFIDLACPSQTIYWGSVNIGGSTHAMAIIGFTI